MTPLDAIRQAAHAPRLDADTERSLAILAQAGDSSAARKVVESNLSWVISSAFKYKRRGVDDTTFQDLVSEGTLGLYHALDKFDPYRNNRFSTYALPWVRVKMQKVLMLVNKDSAMCVPMESGVSAHGMHATVDDSGGQGAKLINVLEDRAPSPEEAVAAARRSAAVQCVLQELRLKPHDHDLIEHRLSVGALERDSLEAIGKRHNITREGVRQRELRLKKLLRQHCRKLREEV
jgi:RNA polymerase sigma factor (sigma-70 family)